MPISALSVLPELLIRAKFLISDLLQNFCTRIHQNGINRIEVWPKISAPQTLVDAKRSALESSIVQLSCIVVNNKKPYFDITSHVTESSTCPVKFIGRFIYLHTLIVLICQVQTVGTTLHIPNYVFHEKDTFIAYFAYLTFYSEV